MVRAFRFSRRQGRSVPIADMSLNVTPPEGALENRDRINDYNSRIFAAGDFDSLKAISTEIISSDLSNFDKAELLTQVDKRYDAIKVTFGRAM